MPLTELQCGNLKGPPEKARTRLFDGFGMYLEEANKAAKYWRLKYRLDGKE